MSRVIVRVVQGGGLADQGAVGEDLHRAEPEPVVAEPGADAQVETCHQVVVGVRAERVQHLPGRHQLDPDAQLALVPGRGVGGQLGRAVRHPAAADAGFGAAGDALLQVLPGGPGDRAGQLGQRVRVDQAAHQELGPLLEQAGGTAAGIGGDPAAGQLGGGRVDAEVGQDHAVHHAHVPGGVPQPDPAPGRGPVQGVPVRGGRRACSGRSRSRSPTPPVPSSRPAGRSPRTARPGCRPGASRCRPRRATCRTRSCGCARRGIRAARSRRAGRRRAPRRAVPRPGR